MLRLNRLAERAGNFCARRDIFLADRYGACHWLEPVENRSPSAFFTNGDDKVLQGYWADEHGLPTFSSPQDILLAQIEEHKTDVFYNVDPMRFSSNFIRTLPGCVKYAIAWRAAPSSGADFSAYDLVVCNFPGILRTYEERGWRSGYLAPSYDHHMDQFAANDDRPTDVLFVGGFSRYHRRRAEILEAVAKLSAEWKVVFHLDRSRMTRIAETSVGWCLPLRRYARPSGIREVSADAIFGIDLYAAISRAKIVLNGSVDMAGDDRGNMRCFESMGCGALMMGDAGSYPQGMVDGQTMLTYRTSSDAVTLIENILSRKADLGRLARNGHELVRSIYSKAAQWKVFEDLVGSC